MLRCGTESVSGLRAGQSGERTAHSLEQSPYSINQQALMLKAIHNQHHKKVVQLIKACEKREVKLSAAKLLAYNENAR